MIRNEAFSLAEDLAAESGGGGTGVPPTPSGGGGSSEDDQQGSGYARILTFILAGLMFGVQLC